jgi:hypothetical protein
MARVHKRKTHLHSLPKRQSYFLSQRWEYVAQYIPFLFGFALFGFGAPPVLAVIFGLTLAFSMAIIVPNLAERKLKVLREADEQAARIQEPHRAAIMEGDQHLKKLERAYIKTSGAFEETLETLIDQTTAILNCVDADPTQLLVATPFLTVELPTCTALVARRIATAEVNNSEALAELDQAIARYIPIFAANQAQVQMPEVSAIELDMKLLHDAMDIEVPES